VTLHIRGRRRRRRPLLRTLVETLPVDDGYTVHVSCFHRDYRRSSVLEADVPAALLELLAEVDDASSEVVVRRCNKCHRLRLVDKLRPAGLARAVCTSGFCDPRPKRERRSIGDYGEVIRGADK
jgi:hypothetical protein